VTGSLPVGDSSPLNVKNKNSALPLHKEEKVLITGPSAGNPSILSQKLQFGGFNKISAPALKASTATRLAGITLAPDIPRLSVTITPLNRISLRSKSVKIGFDKVAGRPDGSSAGTTMWPGMMASMSFFIAALNGFKST